MQPFTSPAYHNLREAHRKVLDKVLDAPIGVSSEDAPFRCTFMHFSLKKDEGAFERFVRDLETKHAVSKVYFVVCSDNTVRGYIEFTRRTTVHSYLVNYRNFIFGVDGLSECEESKLVDWVHKIKTTIRGPYCFTRKAVVTTDLQGVGGYQKSWQLDSYERC